MTTFNFGSEEDNMPEVMILSQEDIASVLDMKSVIEADVYKRQRQSCPASSDILHGPKA